MANSRFVLAPMDGMTHASFRVICFEYGAAGATTEMILSHAFGRAKRRLSDKYLETLARLPEEGNLAAQLIGSDPALMAAAAERITALRRFDALEINMGCPARKVVGSGNGSALMQKPELAISIMEAVMGSTDLPVRLKMRLGWDDQHITAPVLAQAADQLGFESITLHGRTRMQMYRGEVDVRRISEVCAAVRIPVYANGGVRCAEDAVDFLKQTGAYGVAIGRAALKEPWIFDDIERLQAGKPKLNRNAVERIGLVKRLAMLSCQHRPERVAIREMRKFCGWWLPGLTGAERALTQLNSIEKLDDFNRVMDGFLEERTRAGDLEIHPEYQPRATLDTIQM